MDNEIEPLENTIEYWRNETVAFLALTSIKGVSYWTMRKLYQSKIGFKNLLKEKNITRLAKLLRVNFPVGICWDDFQKELWSSGLSKARELTKAGVRVYFYDQNEFPSSLKGIEEPPYWIFIQGSLKNLSERKVAIVGTRKPTEDGFFLTKLVVSALSGYRIVTVSGLAQGIDQLAHIESIRYNIPTVAVLGNGIFKEYPKGSNLLKNKIVDKGGTIITEYLPEQSYSAENFVRRNRLQAALCSVLIPVEWKLKSGTAHTVEYAYRYKKKIINLYLPNTFHERSELAFSGANRDAHNFKVPQDIDLVLEFILNWESNDNTNPSQHFLDL